MTVNHAYTPGGPFQPKLYFTEYISINPAFVKLNLASKNFTVNEYRSLCYVFSIMHSLVTCGNSGVLQTQIRSTSLFHFSMTVVYEQR